MQGDIDLAEVPRPQRLVLLEEVVHGTRKRVEDALPVDLRLWTRLVRRVRQWMVRVCQTVQAAATETGQVDGASKVGGAYLGGVVG